LPGTQFPLRVLPPDWMDPSAAGAASPVMSQFSTAGEYTLYQANRFYRREPLSLDKRNQLEQAGQLRRPKLVDVPPSPSPPKFDFHRIVASFADYAGLLRKLGLVLDCVLPAHSTLDEQIAAGQAEGIIGLSLSWSTAHDTQIDSCPRTAWSANKSRFTTRA